jgi:hypothetical protein
LREVLLDRARLRLRRRARRDDQQRSPTHHQ